MPQVEVFEGEADGAPLFTAEFSCMPRVGEYLSKDADGYLEYYNVVEVWHREDSGTGRFSPCVRVQRDD
jgi:hypothetical protein